jgi:hypothetical protein
MSDFPRKILVSPGFGAGWSSWCYGPKEAAQFVAEYQPIIEFLENGGTNKDKEFQRLVEELETIVDKKFGVNFYTGGSRDLVVKEVDGPYMIEEYDGSESVLEQENADLWFY